MFGECEHLQHTNVTDTLLLMVSVMLLSIRSINSDLTIVMPTEFELMH